MNKLNKFIATILIVVIYASLYCPMVSATTDTKLNETFESYTIGATVGDTGSRAATIDGDTDNKYVSVAVPESGYDNGRYLKKIGSEPESEKLIISIDFKMPGEVNEYRSKVLESSYADGKGSVVDVVLDGGKLYVAKEMTKLQEIRSDFESNKWYNLFVVIDKETRKWKLYCGSYEGEETDFSYLSPVVPEADIEAYDKILWPVTTRNYNTLNPFNIDNCVVTGVSHYDLDIAVYTAKSIMLEAEVGYEDGQYPESALSMFKDVYEKVLPYHTNSSLTNAKATEYALELQDAITLFENSKIDTSGLGGEATYILSNVPNIIMIDDEEGYANTLEAKVFDSAKNELSNDVTWSLEGQYDGVSIVNGQLIVEAGTETNIVLKAIYEDLYLKQEVRLTTGKTVDEFNFIGKGGEIKVTGTMSHVPEVPINLSIVGDDINVDNEVITVDEDKKFMWTGNVPADTPMQTVEISITGDDVKGVLNWTEPYYGLDWEETVLSEVRGAETKEALGLLLGLYDVGLEIDEDVYSRNIDVYQTRIFAGLPYTDFEDLLRSIDKVEYVVKHSEVTRNEIESFINDPDNLKLLTDNGFNLSKFNSLTNTQKNGFYVDASALTIDNYTSTVNSIAVSLNGIIDTIIKNNKPTSSKPTGGGGGGGGFSAGDNSINDNYTIDLVGDEINSGSEFDLQDDIDTSIGQFADVESNSWAGEALLFMRQRKIMIGDGNNVRPGDAVTRGEFVKILVTAFGLKSEKSIQNFNDAEDTWWKEYAEIAAACGVVNGFDDGSFGGDDVINREMMAVIIDRTITYLGKELYAQKESAYFEDMDVISDYAKEAVERLAIKGMVSGIGDNLFAPNLSVSRAEAAQIVYNVIKQL